MKQLTVLILCALLMGSCGFKDIDKRFFVVTMGLDKSKKLENGYKVSLKLALPSPDPKIGGKNSLIISQEGETISEAIRVIRSRVDKDLDFGHAKLIVIGEGLAKKDVRKAMDWIIRRRDIQKIAWMAIGKPSAEKILKQKPTSERLPSSVLFQLFGDTGTESPYIMYTYLFDFLRRLWEPSYSPLLPIIQTGKDSVYQIHSTAIFKDGKATLTLNKEQTKLLNIIAREYDDLDIKVKGDEEYFIVASDSVSVSYSIHIDEDPYVDMHIKIRGVIEESRHSLDEDKLGWYGILTSRAIQQRAESLLKKLQAQGLDPIGFGLRFRARHMGTEKELQAAWEKVYPTLAFRIHVQTDIKGTGIVN